MASRVVGLDVGTHAVRAAELSLGRDAPSLVGFGQVTLPVGAVTDGEVIDAPAVSAALRRLWDEAGFSSRDVIVGVGNPRVIIRQAEMPAMSEEDLRSALRFQVQELIPIPIEDAILDFQVLEHFVGPEQEPMMRVLLVAAQRDMVRSLLAAVEGAGLSASMVDVVPFAMMRSLVSASYGLDPDEAAAEALVDIGAGVTNVVVHEHGVPRFVRTLLTGGEDVSDTIAAELGVDIDTAEDLKRRADPTSNDELEARAAAIVTDKMGPWLEEVRGSLDYYLAQAGDAQIGRTLLTGGGSRLPHLSERLQESLGIPVEPAHPLLGLRVGRTGIPEQDLIRAESLVSVPIGLGLAGRPAENGGRRLTLLPSEVVAVRAQRRQSVLVGAGVGVLALLLVLLWATQGGGVAKENQRAARAEAQATTIQRQLSGQQAATGLETQLQQRRDMVTGALADDVAWTRLFNEIATVIPSDVWLTAFSASKTPDKPDGTVTIGAMGFDHTSAARWLLRVGELPSLTGLWLPSSTASKVGDRRVVTFSSTATLTDKARSDRLQQYLGDGS